MRRSLLLLLVLVCVGAIAADPPPNDKDKKVPLETPKKAPLSVGNDLPGPFHPYNVTGPRKGNYSCLVSANGLHSGLMIIVRGEPEAADAFKDLLQKLDNAVEKNPNVRLGIYVVFVPDDLEDVLTKDKERDELATKIEDIAKGTMLKHVVLALDHKSDLEAFGLEDSAVYTVVAYHKYQILAAEALEKDKLTAEKVQAIITMLGDKLGAKRK